MRPHPSEHSFVVLHSLRVIGFASETRVGAVSDLDSDVVGACLLALAQQGLVTHDPGPFGGWGITTTGRTQDAEWVRTELEVTGARGHVTRAHEAFTVLNGQLLDASFDWQMQKAGGVHVPNDHGDLAYDLAVIDRLAAINRLVDPILGRLSGLLIRFDGYRRRLHRAMDRVDAGQYRYFTDGLDSYHAVWAQLHEDLLATLGIDRFAGA